MCYFVIVLFWTTLQLTEQEKIDFGIANKTRAEILADRQKPRSRFSQNLIFSNMFTGQVSNFLQFYAYRWTKEVQSHMGSWLQKQQEQEQQQQALSLGMTESIWADATSP